MSADSMQTTAPMRPTIDDAAPAELGERWHRTVVLKRDIFSIVERGTYRGPDGDIDAVVRRIDQVPWWTFVFARNFLAREERALAIVGPLGIAPLLYFAGKRVLVRRWIDGVPLHIARPLGDRAYFRSARAALRKLHGAGFCHNDLAKEQNWLRGTDGRAYLTDFQLSAQPKRGRFFRLAAYEDLRHYLKHKRSYVPEALTADRAPHPGAQDLADAALDGDRQARLHLGHARAVPLHRPRGRRTAPCHRCAGTSRRGSRATRRCATSSSWRSRTAVSGPGFTLSSRATRAPTKERSTIS